MAAAQFADPRVSRMKFDREVAEFRALREHYAQRGCFLVHAEYPSALVLLATAKTHVPAIVAAVSFDYTNYDAAPPSVRLVHPLTGEPFTQAQLPTHLNRAVPLPDDVPSPLAWHPPGAVEALQSLMQAHRPEDIPFLCVAGVREYHEHPAHSGDSWELHRASGAGRLIRLLEVIWRYGVEPITGLALQITPRVVGFAFGQPPT